MSNLLGRINLSIRFYENLTKELADFRPPEEDLNVEYNRLLAHPTLILRVIPDRY